MTVRKHNKNKQTPREGAIIAEPPSNRRDRCLRFVGWIKTKIFLSDLPPIERFTGWLTRFTLILAFTALVSVGTFIESERPFLAIYQIKLLAHPEIPAHPYALSITIDNTGKSVGFVDDFTAAVAGYASAITAPNSRPKSPPGPNQPKGLVTPGGRLTVAIEPEKYNAPGALNTDSLDEIIRRGGKIYIVGRISYHGPRVAAADFSFGLSRDGILSDFPAERSHRSAIHLLRV